MTVDQAVLALAGSLVLVSVTLAYFVALPWLLLAVFVGLNAIQSAFKSGPAF